MSQATDGQNIEIARNPGELRDRLKDWRTDRLSVAFVPTMGALHEGHLSLVDLAQANADRVIASIFVNPTQFAPHEDFDTYPREEGPDLEKLADRGTHLVYMPSPAIMYPPHFSTQVTVPDLARGLESETRPHFFQGVATVVTKLLIQAMPDIAIFGEKDYQQLIIIKRLVRDLDLPIQILGGETKREHDGLAMSSRNQYLGTEERQIAGQLNRILKVTANKLRQGQAIQTAINEGISELQQAGFDHVDYLELRDAYDLTPIKAIKRSARLLAAVKIGKTRLIDNWPVLSQDH